MFLIIQVAIDNSSLVIYNGYVFRVQQDMDFEVFVNGSLLFSFRVTIFGNFIKWTLYKILVTFTDENSNQISLIVSIN